MEDGPPTNLRKLDALGVQQVPRALVADFAYNVAIGNIHLVIAERSMKASCSVTWRGMDM